MNSDSDGDTSVHIKACFTLCSRSVSTTKAKRIIPQGVCFILTKTVNKILPKSLPTPTILQTVEFQRYINNKFWLFTHTKVVALFKYLVKSQQVPTGNVNISNSINLLLVIDIKGHQLYTLGSVHTSWRVL